MLTFSHYKNLIPCFKPIDLTCKLILALMAVAVAVAVAAKTDSVLEVIPEDTIAVVQVGNLKKFNQEVNDLVAELDPSIEPNRDILLDTLIALFSKDDDEIDFDQDTNKEARAWLNWAKEASPEEREGMTKSEKFQQLSPEIQEDIKKGLEKLKSKNDKWLNKDVTENFESLEALETEVGLDFSRDAAIFFCQNPNGTKDKPWFSSVAFHIAEQQTLQQVLERESTSILESTYNGLTYQILIDKEENILQPIGFLVILDDVMVFSDSQQICQKAIDTHQRKIQPMSEETGFLSLDLDTDLNDVIFHVAVQRLMQENQQMLFNTFAMWENEVVQESKIEIGNLLQQILSWMQQIQSISLTVQHEDGEILLKPTLQVVSGSEMDNILQPTAESSKNFPLLKYLPSNNCMAMGIYLDSQKMVEMATWGIDFGFKILEQSMVMTLPKDAETISQEFVKAMADFYSSVNPHIAYSMNISSSIYPDNNQIFQIKDKEKLTKLLNDGSIKALFQLPFKINQMVGVVDTEKDMEEELTETYQSIEIKSLIIQDMTNFIPLIPDLPQLRSLRVLRTLPNEIRIYYTIINDLFIMSTSGSSQAIKETIDTVLGQKPGFDQSTGYDRIVDVLDASGYMAMVISPMTLVNQILGLLSQRDPNFSMIAAMFSNIPQTYSLCIGAAPLNQVLEMRFFASMKELKELYKIAAGLGEMFNRK